MHQQKKQLKKFIFTGFFLTQKSLSTVPEITTMKRKDVIKGKNNTLVSPIIFVNKVTLNVLGKYKIKNVRGNIIKNLMIENNKLRYFNNDIFLISFIKSSFLSFELFDIIDLSFLSKLNYF